MLRDDVYTIINEERDYQEALTFSAFHPVAAEILMIQQYAQKAAASWAGERDEAGLDQIRKIAAMQEGFAYIGIDNDQKSIEIAKARLAYWTARNRG
jgi:hypothetical protein